jgi:hypothetical protein
MFEENLLDVATAIFAFCSMWLACGAIIMREELIEKLRQRRHP